MKKNIRNKERERERESMRKIVVQLGRERDVEMKRGRGGEIDKESL